jgi:PAS domain S-box-containing protein
MAPEISKLNQQINDLQTIFEGLQEAVVVQYTDGQLQTLNNRVEQILGMAMEAADFDHLWQTVNQKSPATQPVPVSFQTTTGNWLKLAIRTQTLYHQVETTPYARIISFCDVTAQSQLENTLQQHQQNLDFVMQSKGEALIEWTLHTNHVHYSSQWHTLLGYTPAELGHHINAWHSRIHPTDHPQVLKDLKNCLDGLTSSYHKIHRLQHKDGSYHWLQSQGTVQRDNKGQPYRFLISFSDITEYKRLEQTLETSKKYEQLLAALPEALLLIDNQGQLIDANPTALQFYGYPRQELLKLKITDLTTNDLKLTDSRIPQVTSQKKKDGTLVSVEVMISTFPWQTSKLFILTVRDVSTLRESTAALADSEARYRLLFEAEPEAVIVFDAATHQIVEANPAANRLYGYTRQQWLPLTIANILTNPTQNTLDFRLAGKLKIHKIPLVEHRTSNDTFFPAEVSTSTYKLKDRTLVCAIVRDLTEPQQTEQELRKTLRFANALIQTSPAYFITITPAGKITMLNDTLLQALGYTAEAVIGQDYLTLLIPKSDRPIVTENMKALMSKREPRMLSEMTVVTKDGRHLLVECHCCIMQDAQGQVEYLLAVGIDIGERRQTLQQLQMFKTIVENSNEAIAIRGADKSLIYINPAHQKLFKHTFEQARQSHYRNYLPDTGPKVNQEIRHYIEKQSKTWEGILNMLDTHGRQFPVWARFDAIHDEQGQVLFAFSLMHDVTDQQAMEAALRHEREEYETIFHAAPLMILYKDQDHRIIRANRYAAELFNTSSDLLTGKTIGDLIPAIAQQDGATDNTVIQTGQPQLGLVEPYPKGYLRIDKLPYRDAAGQILGVIVFATDITERIQAEQALHYEHEQYETIFHSAPLSIIYKDRENRIIRANHYAAKQMGYPLKQLAGLSMYDISPEHAQEYHTSDLEVISSGKPKLELIEKHHSGFSQVDKIPYRDADGNIQGVIVFSVNITKRVKTEQALRQQQQVLQASENTLRLAIETLPTMLYVIDDQFNFILWNHECEQVTGYSAAEIVNNPNAWQLLYPDTAYREEMLNTTKEMVENYAGFRDWEWNLTCKDGSSKTILWSGSSKAELTGLSLCAVGQDITEHDQVLQLLCDSEERLRLIIEKMPVMLTAYNDQGQIIFWNRHCEKVTGYKAADLLRHPEALALLYPQPEYRAKLRERHQPVDSYWRWETELTCKDSNQKIIAWSNVSKEFPVSGWHCWLIGEDFTDLRHTQQQFSQPDLLLTTILNGIHHAIAVTDGRGRFVYVNQHYGQLYGYAAPELLQKSIALVIPPDQHQTELRHYFRFLTNSQQETLSGHSNISPRGGPECQVQWVAQRVEMGGTYVVWTVTRMLL